VVPGQAELRSVLLTAQQTGASWSGGPAVALDRMAELATIVVPADPQSLILCHLDVKPDNVLRDAQGGYSLIDWDDFGAGAPDRELASVLLRWYAEGGDLNSGAVSRTLSSYREAGGTVELGWSSFAMLCATSINYVHAQASVVVDRDQPGEARAFAVDELRTAIRLLPDPAVMRKVLSLASPELHE
jgi:aminoglycoside phosphotransferase (APT) family kinase protein